MNFRSKTSLFPQVDFNTLRIQAQYIPILERKQTEIAVALLIDFARWLK
jgi:hypothetical protein